MATLKQWVALAVVASLAIVAAGWFLVISPKRAEASDLRAQAEEQVSANAKLMNDLQVLKAQAKDLPKEQAKLAAVAAKIPHNPGLPSLVRSMIEAAEAAGVELVSIAPGEPTLVEAVAPVTPPAPASGQVTPADGAAPAAPPAQVGSAGQLATIPLSVNVVGDFFEVQQFVTAAEELTRAVRVDNLAITPGTSPTQDTSGAGNAEDGRSLTATVSGYVYMAANRPAPVTATVPGAEGATAETPVADAAAVPTADPAE